MLYRIHRDLSRGGGKIIRRGTISELTELSQSNIDILLRYGHISRVASPPLTVLGEAWRDRSQRLAVIGVATIADLLEADSAAIAKALGYSVKTVDRWKNEAQKHLIA